MTPRLFGFFIALFATFLLAVVAVELGKISHELRVTNCLTLARAGHICTDLARKQ